MNAFYTQISKKVLKNNSLAMLAYTKTIAKNVFFPLIFDFIQ